MLGGGQMACAVRARKHSPMGQNAYQGSDIVGAPLLKKTHIGRKDRRGGQNGWRGSDAPAMPLDKLEDDKLSNHKSFVIELVAPKGAFSFFSSLS